MKVKYIRRFWCLTRIWQKKEKISDIHCTSLSPLISPPSATLTHVYGNFENTSALHMREWISQCPRAVSFNTEHYLSLRDQKFSMFFQPKFFRIAQTPLPPSTILNEKTYSRDTNKCCSSATWCWQRAHLGFAHIHYYMIYIVLYCDLYSISFVISHIINNVIQ